VRTRENKVSHESLLGVCVPWLGPLAGVPLGLGCTPCAHGCAPAWEGVVLPWVYPGLELSCSEVPCWEGSGDVPAVVTLGSWNVRQEWWSLVVT